MALSKPRLKLDIVERLAILFANPAQPPDPTAIWGEIAEAVIDEFTNHAELQVQIPIGMVLVAAQAGVPNAAPINLKGVPVPECPLPVTPLTCEIGGIT